MESLSLLEGCQNIFEKSHEIWKSYFSKWETLAVLEEDLPDDACIGEEKAQENKLTKKRTVPLKKKMFLKKKAVRKEKFGEKNRNKSGGKAIERPKDSGNENLPDETDNKQLEMHLRTIFMDILKANENKWEVFAVLSQTFSHGDLTIKRIHTLRPNHQLALPSNDVEQRKNLFFRKLEIFSPNPSIASVLDGFSAGVEVFESSVSTLDVGRKKAFNCVVPNRDVAVRKFGPCGANTSGTFTSAYLKSRSLSLSFNSPSYNKIKLKPLEFRQENTPESCRKMKNECFCERNIPEMNITREEKRFGSLCLHKRTNDLNMENSNFITPERNSSERKCFSENISQRKRRRPMKLFFDFRDSSDSENEEQTKSSTPRILWQEKTRKIEALDSDSDESESIL